MLVEPNSVFVIPPNRYMGILHGKLHCLESTALPGHRTPIDCFFRTLAEDQEENPICIVLSGTGTEGTPALRTVKRSVEWATKRLIKVGDRASYHARRGHVHAALVFLLNHHYHTVFG